MSDHQPIPVSAAKDVAKRYGYHQVVIIARHVGDDGMEHVTTYGLDPSHCAVAARIGDHIKHKIMGWPQEEGYAGNKHQHEVCEGKR